MALLWEVWTGIASFVKTFSKSHHSGGPCSPGEGPWYKWTCRSKDADLAQPQPSWQRLQWPLQGMLPMIFPVLGFNDAKKKKEIRSPKKDCTLSYFNQLRSKPIQKSLQLSLACSCLMRAVVWVRGSVHRRNVSDECEPAPWTWTFLDIQSVLMFYIRASVWTSYKCA